MAQFTLPKNSKLFTAMAQKHIFVGNINIFTLFAKYMIAKENKSMAVNLLLCCAAPSSDETDNDL